MKDLAIYIAANVIEDCGCLRWTGYLYGGHPGGTIGGRRILIRRALWDAEHGPIPRGMVIRCTCKTPLCVAHLECVTRKVIARDCGAAGLMSGPVRSAKIAAVKRASSQAKLTEDQAREIRCSDDTEHVLAKRYGVSVCTVGRIRRGQMWREFAGNPWVGLVEACPRQQPAKDAAS